MGKRKGECLSLTALLLVFMLTTLFFYMVYNMHYDSASDDFTGFTVFDYQSEPGVQASAELGTLREDLDDWARRNQAVVFYKGFSSAGIAALDYAGWFQRTWQTPFDGREAKTALIQKENGNLYTYTEGDTLFPGTYNYHILGEFDGNLSPTFQGDAFFYYPLMDITDLQGLLFTNVDSGESLSELTGIIEKTGRSIEYQTYTDSNLNILAPVQVLQQRIIAPIEKCFSDRRKSHAQHPRQHPPPKDLRTAKHCQLRQNPCREENGHIRRNCTEQAVQGQNREKPRRYTMQFLDGAQMHCSCLAHRYFFLHIQNALPS